MKFRTLIHELRHLSGDLPLPALLRQLLDATDYLDQFDDSDDDDRSRWRIIEELLSAAQSFTEETAYRDAAIDDTLSGLPRSRGPGVGHRRSSDAAACR